jgi:hypothetical protein
MSELSGTLEGVGLPAIVRFLTGLKKTGCLQVQHDGWHGEIYFASGEVRNAALGSRRGLPALDALLAANQPGGNFTFETDVALPPTRDVEFDADALLGHLDEFGARETHGHVPQLPPLDAIPAVIEQPESDAGEEPLPLDRGTLQTLLAVDGTRSVREIMAQRGSFDALWQLGNLVQVGLVQLCTGAAAPAASAPTPAPVASAPAPVPAPTAPSAPPTNVRHIGESTTDVARCPKLGFEDDPSTSFGRPTRLHRCFAAGTPLPLSLDQQRELCISEQFGSCPRLATATSTDHIVGEPADPRIVRLPVSGRHAVADRHAVGASDPARFRQNVPSHDPTPLRSRQERNTTAIDRPAAPPREAPAQEPRAPRRAPIIEAAPAPHVFGVPVVALAAAVVGMLAIGALGFLIAPQLGDPFADGTTDLESLPNSSALVAGTPITQLTPRRTPVAVRPTAVPDAPEISPTTTTSPTITTSPSGASADRASVQPALTPEPTAVPTIAAPTEVPVVAAVTVLDERFTDNARKWPSSPQGTAVLTSGSYRLIPRAAGQFVAVGAPIVTTPLRDVVVSATFHKVSGPVGGGYGIIVRDQSATPQNGTTQNGQYYVLEVGDNGDVGMWRRENDHWVDLLPWQKSDAVKKGSGTNDVVVRAIGSRLSLLVNGVQVASRDDSTLPSGLVGVFAGGDGNVVSVDRFTVQTP